MLNKKNEKREGKEVRTFINAVCAWDRVLDT